MNWRVGNKRLLIVASVVYWVLAVLKTVDVIDHEESAAFNAMWRVDVPRPYAEMEKVHHIALQEGLATGGMALAGFALGYVVLLLAYRAVVWVMKGYRTA